MNYRLMHKNIPVLAFVLDDATCSILRILEIYHKEHIPVGISVTKGKVDRAALNEWWRGRSIPASRQGIREALQELEVHAPQNLLDKSMGLSLSDQYWICPEASQMNWSDINFFENSFSGDVGNVLFGKGTSETGIDLLSPDNTSDGWLKKRWTIIDGKRCLLKGGSGINRQEPYNEVFAGRLMERLKIPHVTYELVMEDGEPYSVCEDFITPQTELVSAWYIMQTQKKENHTSVYQHYRNCCEHLGIKGVREALDRMMVVDYLIVNEDRHQNNFGVIRNAETLEWLGTAPIYDSGTSLWFQTPTGMITGATPNAACKPFKTRHEEQIKLVSTFDWLERSALYGIEEEFKEIVRKSSFIDEVRCDTICKAIGKRVEMLLSAAESISCKDRVFFAGMDYEVKDDISYQGK